MARQNPQREFVDLAPPRTGLERFGLAPYRLSRGVPWWLQLAALAGLAWMAPRLVGLAAGLLDAGVEFLNPPDVNMLFAQVRSRSQASMRQR